MSKTKSSKATILRPRKNEDGEWRIGVLVNGKDCEPRAYYTDDKDDAFATFAAMVAEENREKD